MKLYISILDLTTIYNYNNPFINIWTNQKRLIYKLNKSDGGTVFRFNLIPNTPLGVVFGVYGYTNTNKIHSIGQCVLDGSKMKPEIENSFVINIMDSTTNIPKTGVLHVSIKWSPEKIPPPIPIKDVNLLCLHNAAESNLNLIHPYSVCGLKPFVPILHRMHSPYYTSNIGVQLPSGAFLLDTGKSSGNHLERLKTVIQCVGSTETQFINGVKNITQSRFENETNAILLILARTLTMHPNQCLTYVSDVQYDDKEAKPTDRWECPRYDSNNYVGDCEDCAKEIFIEIKEWQRMPSTDPLVLAMQNLLSYYVPIVVQGCVRINGSHLNHIWAALVAKKTFYDNLIDMNNPTKEYISLPTLLLEGTAPTYPIYIHENDRNSALKTIKELKKENIKNVSITDMNPHKFYKYVVACMTPLWHDKGYLDFTYVNKDFYGIPFDMWWQGKYKMKASCRHSKRTIDLIKEVVTYDKPIMPLTYNIKSYTKIGTMNDSSTKNIVFGYRVKNIQDEKHSRIKKCIDQLKNKFNICGHIIDHGISIWVEWVVNKPESLGLFIL